MPIPAYQIADSRFSLQVRYPFITELLAQADIVPAGRDVIADAEIVGDESEAEANGDGDKSTYLAPANRQPPNPPGSNPPAWNPSSSSATWILNIGNFIAENITVTAVVLGGIALALTGLATAIFKFRTGFLKLIRSFISWQNIVSIFKEPGVIPIRDTVVGEFRGLAVKKGSEKYGQLFRGLPYAVQEFVAKTAIEDHWDKYWNITKNVFIQIDEKDFYIRGALPLSVVTAVAKKLLKPYNVDALTAAARNWYAQRVTDSIDFAKVLDQLIAIRPEIAQLPYKARERLAKLVIENWRNLDIPQRAAHIDINQYSDKRPFTRGPLQQSFVSNYMSQITDEHLESMRADTDNAATNGRERRSTGRRKPLARRTHHLPILSRTRFARQRIGIMRRGALMARRVGAVA